MRQAWRFAAAVATGLAAGGTAPAFYFAGWPGDGRPREQSFINPAAEIWEHPQGGRNDEWYSEAPRSEHPDHDEHDPSHGGSHPSSTPEPGTLVTAGIGIAVVGLAARRRKK